jgi:peptidylprolyl isomerase
MAKKRATKKGTRKTAPKKTVTKVPAKKSLSKKQNKTFCHKSLMGMFLVVIVLGFLIIGGNGNMIEKGSKIKLHYTGTLEDGTVFDSSKDKEPLEFEVGAGQVIPGFDEGVIGLKAGEKKTINIPADKAYGQYDEKRMGEYPKENVPKDMELKVGAKMFLQSPDGGVALATIKEIKEEVVLLDLNHPLAGKDLTFEVEIIEVN